MVKRQIGYVVLVGFATLLIVLLMLDDPAAEQAQWNEQRATQQAAAPLVLYPDLRDPAQVVGIEVLATATGRGILVQRDDRGRWIAPEIPAIQEARGSDELDQTLLDTVAQALVHLTAWQQFEATSENFERYGFQPQPPYLVRFRVVVNDQIGEGTIEIGITNPNGVAYYVWPGTGPSIYLIPNVFIDPILGMVPEELAPTTEDQSEATVPVP